MDEPGGAHVLLYRIDEAVPVQQVLLFKRDGHWKIDVEPGYWTLAGGLINPGEDPVQTVLREVSEEVIGLQLKAADLTPLCCARKQFLIHFFAAPFREHLSELRLGPEGDGFGLFSEEESERLPLRPRDRLAIHVFFGHVKIEGLGPCEDCRIAVADHRNLRWWHAPA